MVELFSLARPWLLGLLVLVPFWVVRRRRQRPTVPFAPLQYAALPAGGRWVSWVVPGVEGLLLAVLVVGSAGPYRETRLELTRESGIDVMLVLDVSLSMLAEDIPPNRLEALRRVGRGFLARGGANRVGILVFAGDVYVQTPLTADRRSLAELLEDVTVYTLSQHRSGGTAVGDALLVAGQRLAASRVPGRDQSVILITDGDSNFGIEPELAARWIAAEGIRLYAVGVGGSEPVEVVFEPKTPGGGTSFLTVLDDARLRTMADAAGGRYFRATDGGTLEEIFAELSRLESAPLEGRTVVTRRGESRPFALAAGALFLVQLILGGWVLRRPFA